MTKYRARCSRTSLTFTSQSKCSIRNEWIKHSLVTCQTTNIGEQEDDVVEIQLNQLYVGQKYLLYLVGVTLFSNKSVTYVYFCDIKMVHGFSWMTTDLAYFYKELNVVCHYKTMQLASYLTCLM